MSLEFLSLTLYVQNQSKLTALSMANLFIIFSSTLSDVSFSPNLLSINLLLLNLWLYSWSNVAFLWIWQKENIVNSTGYIEMFNKQLVHKNLANLLDSFRSWQPWHPSVVLGYFTAHYFLFLSIYLDLKWINFLFWISLFIPCFIRKVFLLFGHIYPLLKYQSQFLYFSMVEY